MDLENKEMKEKQITAEIIMSSGPRKTDQDNELGEDAAGVFLTPEAGFFWVADGTSECPIIKDKDKKFNFSSRTLAQELGNSFRKHVINFSERTNIQAVLENSFKDVFAEWNQRIQEFLSKPENRDDLEKIWGSPISVIDFSTTFTCGMLSKTGMLHVALYGDSPLVVIAKQKSDYIVVCRSDPYHFYMRLHRKDNNYYFSTSTDIKIESKVYNDVSIVIAGSDGIGKLPELIKTQHATFPFQEIRDRIHKFIPKTHDDKTLCILSLEHY